jgi:uncharacterized protein YqeY
MSLYKKIEDDMRNALRQGNAVTLSVLRMLISAMKMREIEKNVKDLDDAEALQIIQRHIKQHKESIAQFEKGNRPDLVEKEAMELKVLEAYMPEQLSRDEIAAIVKAAIAESGAASKSDTGKVMKLVMEKVKGRADGKTVSQLVAELLP